LMRAEPTVIITSPTGAPPLRASRVGKKRRRNADGLEEPLSDRGGFSPGFGPGRRNPPGRLPDGQIRKRVRWGPEEVPQGVYPSVALVAPWLMGVNRDIWESTRVPLGPPLPTSSNKGGARSGGGSSPSSSEGGESSPSRPKDGEAKGPVNMNDRDSSSGDDWISESYSPRLRPETPA
jgi:hypothetical protein